MIPQPGPRAEASWSIYFRRFFIISDLNQTIVERVEEVTEELELQVNLKLSNKQIDEDVNWYLIVNTISGDAEITLKGCQLVL